MATAAAIDACNLLSGDDDGTPVPFGRQGQLVVSQRLEHSDQRLASEGACEHAKASPWRNGTCVLALQARRSHQEQRRRYNPQCDRGESPVLKTSPAVLSRRK